MSGDRMVSITRTSGREMFRHGSVRIAMLLSVLVSFPFIFALGGGLNESTTADMVELLVSDRAGERKRGERLVEEKRSYYVSMLIERIRNGSPIAKGRAASELGIIISPWLRGKEAGQRFHQYCSFEAPWRPVERPPRFEEAKKIRQVLEGAISALLEKTSVEPEQAFWISAALRACCETLGEVADDATVDWTIDRLRRIESPSLGEALLAMGDSYLGVRPIFRQGGICGNSTAGEVERFRQSEKKEFEAAVDELSKLWSEVRPLETGGRIQFAMKKWRDYFVPLQNSYSGHYLHEGWLFVEMEPLIRFGGPAVELLRSQQALETELEAKGVWEVVIASITGRTNASLMSALFAGRDPHLELACEIAVASSSRDWLSQLDKLQYRSGFDSGKASMAIAICHRELGIPSLKGAFEEHDSNSGAKYGIQELEVRAVSGPPRGMRRFRFPDVDEKSEN